MLLLKEKVAFPFLDLSLGSCKSPQILSVQNHVILQNQTIYEGS